MVGVRSATSLRHDPGMPHAMSYDYRRLFAALHAAVAAMPLGDASLTSFWPMVGAKYAGDLVVVDRAVNGWRTDWSVSQALSPAALDAIVEDAAAANTVAPDPMDWVVRLWGNGGTAFDGFADSRYNTARSAFWRVCRQLSVAGPWDRSPADWSSFLAWTNLYKIAPAEGWNPGGSLLASQRAASGALLAREIQELAPRTVVALTGRSWFEPFVDLLGLDVEWRAGLLEGFATSGSTRWVIAKHPMGKPQAQWLAEVRSVLR
jgi:hypothetical protein